MTIEQQVCALYQAKRLKELGVTAAPTFMYIDTGNRPVIVSTQSGVHDEYLPAFNVAELGVMTNSEEYTVRDGSEMSEYANWSWFNDGNEVGSGLFATEADARANRLIKLLETGEVTADEVNERLSV